MNPFADNQLEQDNNYVPLEKKKEDKVKNPFDTGDKNPFKYDSSDSESDEEQKEKKVSTEAQNEPKAVWKEKLFFAKFDYRFKGIFNYVLSYYILIR